MRRIIPVWQVNQYVGELIQSDYSLTDLWVEGEVFNCKYYPSGIYFTIKDYRASLKAVMFVQEVSHLSFRLQEGMKIYARVRLELYEKAGIYQAIVKDIEKQGRGILYEQFEQLKIKLEAEGLFDEKLKKPIPLFPKHVGIITSKSGAAIHDIIKISKRRNDTVLLTLYPVHVQGEKAVTDIVEAIKIANSEKRVEVIILGRGGGSIEDLWAFNEEPVARAIAASHIPIVSAVGHEIDFTISDFISDKRAATPSAAAELIVPSKDEWLAKIDNKRKRLSYLLIQKLEDAKHRVEKAASYPLFTNKTRYLNTKLQELDTYYYKLKTSYEKNLQIYQKRYELALHNLDRLSPLNTLKRGYSLVSLQNGKILKSSDEVTIGSTVEIQLAQGKLQATIERKER